MQGPLPQDGMMHFSCLAGRVTGCKIEVSVEALRTVSLLSTWFMSAEQCPRLLNYGHGDAMCTIG